MTPMCARSMPLLEATFAPWTAGDAPRGEATYPYLRVRGEIAIIGLTSAVPTGPLMATGQARQEAARGVRRIARRDRRQGAGAGRAHSPPADRRRHAAAARSFRRGGVRADRARPRRRGDPAWPHPRAGRALASLARRAHGRRRGSGDRRALRRGAPPATRAIAPPIISCASIATAIAGGSAPAPAGLRRKARRSANGRR